MSERIAQLMKEKEEPECERRLFTLPLLLLVRLFRRISSPPIFLPICPLFPDGAHTVPRTVGRQSALPAPLSEYIGEPPGKKSHSHRSTAVSWRAGVGATTKRLTLAKTSS